LRPITLISLNDQVVYQAIGNFIANKFVKSLSPYYGQKTFGGQYAGKSSKFFFRSWQRGYEGFTSAIRLAYTKGNVVLADFDLVAFFDLIDHKILRAVLESKVKNGEVLDLLCECLERWTVGNPNALIRGHGIPQGPEPSAFLAEVLLNHFDRGTYGHVTYLRYVDDIKLLGPSFSAVRRALVKLDLQSKRLGLVPQAQKIEVRGVADINAELKTVPSMLAGITGQVPLSKSKTAKLESLLRKSIKKVNGELVVTNETHFKFALYRLRPIEGRII
jgi:hypothetical protein